MVNKVMLVLPFSWYSSHYSTTSGRSLSLSSYYNSLGKPVYAESKCQFVVVSVGSKALRSSSSMNEGSKSSYSH